MIKWAHDVFMAEEIARNTSNSSPVLTMEGPTQTAYNSLVSQLKSKAMKELSLPSKDIISRPLRPEDLGLSTPRWSFNITTGDWNTLVDIAVADNRFIGINGVVCLETTTQGISQIEITSGGRVSRIFNVEGIILLDNPIFYTDEPLISTQNSNLTIKGYAIATSTAEKFGFLGAVVEKRGLVLNP
jgi:hypothetical protein